jgi:hypothetical protein
MSKYEIDLKLRDQDGNVRIKVEAVNEGEWFVYHYDQSGNEISYTTWHGFTEVRTFDSNNNCTQRTFTENY